MWGKGEEGGEPGAPFCVLSHSNESPESRGRAEFPPDLFSDFRHWRALILLCVFLSSQKHTPPVSFTTVILIATMCAGSTDILWFFCPLIWLYTPLCCFRYLPYWFSHFLSDFFRFHFLFLPSLCLVLFLFSFAPLSSAPARRSTSNHICTTPCRFDQICHFLPPPHKKRSKTFVVPKSYK